jgi:hypothetical protein
MRKYVRPELLLLLVPLLYVGTLARGLVLGDPSEYTFVANTLSIAHPPGYAFITLLGKLVQTVVPFGDIPWRMHLLSALSATTAVFFVYGTVFTVATKRDKPGKQVPVASLAAVFAALTVAFGTDFWQHAIHANPHIITATFLSANLFFLTRWWTALKEPDAAWPSRQSKSAERWLLLFSFTAGLGVTHHPLTVFSWPAYLVFILMVRPSIWREWRTILKMLAVALLGLSVWLYFPLRTVFGPPPFGPTTMNTLGGFLDHVLGRGITEALPYYNLSEQPDRALVFWSLLRLQYALPVIFLAALALLWPLMQRLAQRAGRIPLLDVPGAPLLLYSLAFLCNYAFVISLKAQDLMAYLLGPLLVIGLLAGIGFYFLLNLTTEGLGMRRTAVWLLAGGLFLLGPAGQVVRNVPRISLGSYDEGNAYVTAVFTDFTGQGEGAVLLNDWEHMTPLWYTQLVEERWPDAADIRPEYVSTARTWLDNVFDFLPGGPVYLSNYRREIVDAGFRLRPFGPFYRVVEPGDQSLPPTMTPLNGGANAVEIVGYELPRRAAGTGEYVSLSLALRAPEGTTDYFVPVLTLGDLSFPFTTDSHVVSPDWQPGEIIIERFDFALPHDLPPGDYPLQASLKNLSKDEDSGPVLDLGTLTVSASTNPAVTENLLANFRQRVGLAWATARGNGRAVAAPWPEPLRAEPGDIIKLRLGWRSLEYAEESYTVFVHLIDQANRPLVALDYTPLGGAAPTHLWIPKWLPGQAYTDPYRLEIPADLPPGTYLIEVGLYEMVGRRRLHIADEAGNLIGDRIILGSVIVGE